MTKIYEKYNIKTQGNLIKDEILRLPKKDQDLEIALWALNFLDDYRFKPEPTPPQKFMDYMKLPKETRKKMNKIPQDFLSLWGDDEVKNFLTERDTVRVYNYRNKQFLEWMRGILGSEHHAAIDVKLYQFKDLGYNIEQPEWQDDN